MPYYAAVGSTTPTSGSYKTITEIQNNATTADAARIKIYEIMVGAINNPNSTDCAVQCDVSRQTATASAAGTNLTANAIDPADRACFTTGLIGLTTEPTVSSSSTLWNIGMNQRATVRWIAAQESQYLISVATTGFGFTLRAISANFATSFDGQLTFME